MLCLYHRHAIRRLPLVVIALSALLAGCATSLTHDYAQYNRLDTDKAISLIYDLYVAYHDKEGIGLPNSITATKVAAVDQAGFEYVASYAVLDYRSPGTCYSPYGCTYTVTTRYHIDEARVRVNFSDVTKIEYNTVSRGGVVIHLHTNSNRETIDLVWNYSLDVDEHLSAILELCTNVS